MIARNGNSERSFHSRQRAQLVHIKFEILAMQRQNIRMPTELIKYATVIRIVRFKNKR